MGRRTNVQDKEWSGWPAICSKFSFKVLTKKFVKDGSSQLHNFLVIFYKFHALFSMRLSQARLSSWVLCKMGSENVHGCTQNTQNGFDFDFLEWYHKNGYEFLNHIVGVTGDEPWVPFVKVETKEQSSSRCTHICQTSQNSLNRHYLPARKLMATVFWDRKRVLMVEFMQHGTTIMSEVYCETLRKLSRVIQNKGMECWHSLYL
jgi:hypothetical protein